MRISMNRALRLKNKRKFSAGIPGFVEWVKETHPKVYDAAQTSPDLSGIGDATDVATANGSGSKIVDALTGAAAKLLPLYQDQQMFKMQMERAKIGLPPVSSGDYMANSGYQFGVNQSTQNTMLKLGGILIAGLLAFRLLGRKKS